MRVWFTRGTNEETEPHMALPTRHSAIPPNHLQIKIWLLGCLTDSILVLYTLIYTLYWLYTSIWTLYGQDKTNSLDKRICPCHFNKCLQYVLFNSLYYGLAKIWPSTNVVVMVFRSVIRQQLGFLSELSTFYLLWATMARAYPSWFGREVKSKPCQINQLIAGWETYTDGPWFMATFIHWVI